ncbi:Hypothetical predicted protein [Paramuricea clavata]|uniref:Uncharacterized protein n=1 Tax=Paramuricea clavata TaxID=317549 RepID=A0A6S7GVT8_PARCT|nr:Hypothetical predicted protein [Paramuricea clavata]
MQSFIAAKNRSFHAIQLSSISSLFSGQCQGTTSIDNIILRNVCDNHCHSNLT